MMGSSTLVLIYSASFLFLTRKISLEPLEAFGLIMNGYFILVFGTGTIFFNSLRRLDLFWQSIKVDNGETITRHGILFKYRHRINNSSSIVGMIKSILLRLTYLLIYGMYD